LAGEQFRLQGNQQKAFENFEQANARRPDIAELRATIVEMGGKPTGDGTIPRSAIQQNEDRLYQQAHDAEQKSGAAFERVISLAPDSYRAHQALAYALVSQQKYDQAIQEYRLVLQQKPDLPGVHEAIGSSLMRSGKTEEALVEFEAERKLQPHSASANTNVGQALLMMGKDEEADKSLRAALRMDRPPSEIYRLLGKVDLHRKDYRSAVSDLTQYLELKKDDAMAYYLLSRAYRGLGEKEQMNQALSQFEKVSQDVKARSQAQGELERFGNPRPIDDDVEKADASSEVR
jgi:tetratricopeptide (TPR) repeat protein